MPEILNLLDDKGWYPFRKKLQLIRKYHLESGGDPRDFPKFLEEHGIKADGFLIFVDERATTLEQLLKD